jgi:hypothetical protein
MKGRFAYLDVENRTDCLSKNQQAEVVYELDFSSFCPFPF